MILETSMSEGSDLFLCFVVEIFVLLRLFADFVWSCVLLVSVCVCRLRFFYLIVAVCVCIARLLHFSIGLHIVFTCVVLLVSFWVVV